jgi:UDP-N-acetylmuramoyl-tripeptide--D-alanyl-D-alanine ligase
MSLWTIDEVTAATGGRLEQRGTLPLEGVCTDSRIKQNNMVFIALRGAQYDAHEYAGQAVGNGASLLIVDKKIPKVSPDVSVVSVEDTTKALQAFAKWHRTRWNGKLVGITGSNGKTTTKEFTLAILKQKFPVLATQGNLNNHFGVPLTLLELRPHHRFAVIEMGMNHAGEIADLTEIARPDVVLVTNVGRAHIEFFGTIEGIARAKEEIYESAPPKATRIYNLDDPHTAIMRARAPGGCRVLTYSSYAKGVDVSFKEKLSTLEYLEVQGIIDGEPGSVKIPVFGRQHLTTAMAASCVGLACGVDAPLIWKGLQQCKSGWGRGQMVDLEGGAKVIFDGYNANPDSVQVALENFSKVAARGKKYVVFGDMRELGESSARAHREVGEKLALINPEAVLLIGAFGKEVETGLRSRGYKKNIVVSSNYEEKLASSFGAVLQTGDVVLVKGSRGMKLERVIQLWRPLNFAHGLGNNNH